MFGVLDWKGRAVRGTLNERGECTWGPFATRDEAMAWVHAEEKRVGQMPGIDHGFGMGLGYRVVPADQSKSDVRKVRR